MKQSNNRYHMAVMKAMASSRNKNKKFIQRMKIPGSCDKPFILIKKRKQITLSMNGQEASTKCIFSFLSIS